MICICLARAGLAPEFAASDHFAFPAIDVEAEAGAEGEVLGGAEGVGG